MLWGGLRPIPSRLAVDTLTIGFLFFSALTSPDITNGAILALACVTTIGTAGLTSRWTMSFPLLPFVVLQGLRRVEWVVGTDVAADSPMSWPGLIIGTLSIILLLISTALTILFPAVELGPIKGKYNVGIIDLHLPVDFTEGVRRGSLLGTQHQEDEPSKAYVSARLLYPTNDAPENLPYLDPQSAALICNEFMKAGAPGPLKKFGWILQYWRFTTLKAKRNAQPVSAETCDGKLPLAVYSHGLSGIASIYSYQTMNLAAHGTAVLLVDHTDETAIAVRRRDSSHLLYSRKLVTEFYEKGKIEEYEQRRQAQAQHRVEECVQAMKVLKSLNRQNIPELVSMGVSFVDRLDLSDVTIMGHSFGATTALAVAAQHPDLVSTVVAHEPSMLWMPVDAKKSFFAPTEKTDEKEDEKKDDPQEENPNKKTIHDINMLILYSDQWAKNGWESIKEVKDMHERQLLGPKNGTSDVGVIKKAAHQEFSDTCMLIPLWLARPTGVTGQRNPIETAEEIACRTMEFLEATRSLSKQ